MKVKNFLAKIAIEELCRLGVCYFCVAPGSRNTPLVYEIAHHSKASDFVHYDERGLAFHALGYGKATQKPAVIVVTSGSALANLFPAVIEAHYSHVPLLILSADRPFELHDCGSNQAIDQSKFFQSYVRWYSDIPFCDNQLPAESICNAMSYGIAKAHSGPVHLNCRFREPFFQEVEVDETFFAQWSQTQKPRCDYLQSPASKSKDMDLSLGEKGVIIIGRSTKKSELSSIVDLSEKLNYPIFADILCEQSALLNQKSIRNYESILKAKPNLSFDCVLQFGDTFTSKTLLMRLKKFPPKNYYLITDTLKRSDPNHLQNSTLICHTDEFCSAAKNLEQKSPNTWLEFWKSKNHQVSTFLHRFFSQSPLLSEPAAMRAVFQNAVSSQLFYIASSMPIRDAIAFNANLTPLQIYCNRGASGTDGNLATAFGLSQGKKQAITIVIGDIAFLYDLNSLAMISELKAPPRIVVINNSGCGIFSFLPIAQHKEIFDRYFQAKHPLTFQGAAEQFDLEYHHPQNLAQLNTILQNPVNKAQLIEVTTQSQKNLELHQSIDRELADALA